MTICLLFPVHTSYPTSNASSKAQCQHNCIFRKSLVLLSTHLFVAAEQEMRIIQQQCTEMNDRGTWPETSWATLCLPLHNPTTAAGSLKQEEIHPFPKDIPTCVVALCFFPPTGRSLGRVWQLHYLFQNPGLNKFSSIGLVTFLSSAAGWWYSLPRTGLVLVRAAPGNRMPGE